MLLFYINEAKKLNWHPNHLKVFLDEFMIILQMFLSKGESIYITSVLGIDALASVHEYYLDSRHILLTYLKLSLES
jgi:hypothetical protein